MYVISAVIIGKSNIDQIRDFTHFIQVYCYGMLTNNPKEYITLKTGPQKNFAEYYHRRLVVKLTWIKILARFSLNRTKAITHYSFVLYFSLKNPSKCPYSGARRDDCPLCHRELFPSSGGTYFSKVRFDVSRMSLIGKHGYDFVNV